MLTSPTQPVTTTDRALTRTRPRSTSRPDRSTSPIAVSQTARRVHRRSRSGRWSDVRSLFGAQMLDIYVHNPAAATTSTAAGVPAAQLHDRVADAWSERLEAQGFASPVWIDPSGNVGRPRCSWPTTPSTRRRRPAESAFGTVGSGWTFTVAFTGQDGFSPDQARGFAPRRRTSRSASASRATRARSARSTRGRCPR